MIEIYLIYLIYLGLYFFESLYWIPKNSVFLSFSKKNNAKLHYTSELFCNQNRSLALSSLSNPYKIFSVLSVPQISISDESIIAYSVTSLNEREQQLSYQKYHFSEIEKIESDDNTLLINNKKFVKFYSATEATFWAKSISNILQVEQEACEENINSLLDSIFDESAIQSKIENCIKNTKALRIINSILFIVLVANACMSFMFDWFLDYFLYSIIAMYTVSAISGLHFYFSQIELLSAKKSKQIFSMLKMMFYPPSAIGSVSEISTHLFSHYNILAVLYQLCDEKLFEKFAGKIYRDLLFPLAHTYPPDDLEYKKIEESWRNRILKKTEQFLLDNNIDINKLLQPEICNNESSYFCPRCLTLYSLQLDNCSDCYGVKPIKIS